MSLNCKCERCEAVRSSAAYVIASQDLNELDTGLLYLAMSLDKPIVMVILRGCKVPDKLAKVVDRFVEMTPGMKAGQMMEAVKAALIDLIRTAPSQIEKTARTRRSRHARSSPRLRLIRPMRCATCGTTQGFRRIVKFGGERGKRCSKCERGI